MTMIRPCDQCDGNGEVHCTDAGCSGRDHEYGDGSMIECPRCADMPWLPCLRLRNGRHPSYMPRPGEPDGPCPICGGSGRFKPDPDTVIRWCFEHLSKVDSLQTRCTLWMLDSIQDFENEHCEIGWVETPTRLDEATGW